MAAPGDPPEHVPVMLEEVIEHLRPDGAGLIVDATIGGGGHAAALLDAAGPEARLLGIDWDEQALERARANLARFEGRFRLLSRNFAEIGEILASGTDSGQAPDILLLDLGLSAFHVETPERGFSFRQEGLLDMRMDRRAKTTAADLVNRLDAKALAELLRNYGGERKARAVARKICEAREREPIRTTLELARIVTRGVRPRGRWKIHPATRSFQALRMEVNQEIPNLERALPEAAGALAPGGRMAVIAFHSTEDRVVKINFKRLAATGPYEIVTRKPLVPPLAERRRNARARSAKLRVLRRTP